MTTAALSDSAPSRVWPARLGRLAPWGLGLVAAVLVAGGFSLGIELSNLHNGLIAAAFTAVGLVVLAKRPGEREAWLFIAVGVAHALMFFGRQYGLATGLHLPGAEWVLWVGVWPLALVLVLIGVTLICFPTGTLPSPRWRPVIAVMVVAGATLSLASALWPVEYSDNSLSLDHPLTVPGAAVAQQVWNVAGPACYLLFQIAWVAGVLTRLRRARGDQARQLRLFAWAVAVTAVVMVAGLVLTGSPLPGVLSVPLIPIVAGMAIVRYRLYDVDLVISRSLVVAVMASIITAAYVLIVAGAGEVLGASAAGDGIAPLVATAIVAVAFEPVRRRVQVWADRLVRGRRPTPYEALARLSARLADGGEPADLFGGLVTALAEGVGATKVTLWAGTAEDLVAVSSWPGDETVLASRTLESLDGNGRTHVRPIRHQGVLRGAVSLVTARGDALTAEDEQLLADLVAQAGLVIDHAGLTTELQRRLHQISAQAVQLQAAAKRIVTAHDEARRRIERDLHDGAQQQLVTLALSLQSLSARVPSGSGVEEAQAQLSQALSELREMARGIHPAILSQEGLPAALEFLAERAPIPTHIDVLIPHRLPPEVESTAWFVAREALTNVAKHADASAVWITGGLDGDRLWLEIRDDGCGGAGAGGALNPSAGSAVSGSANDEPGTVGSGLQGLADRLGALDGRLTVDSPIGGGTRLRAELPCE